MTEFFTQAIRVLKDGGYVALFFNARDDESWEYLKSIENTITSFLFVGCFPMVYSATSVVQDNRKAAMKNDYVIIYRKNGARPLCQFPIEITTIPGWSSQFPVRK